MTFELPSPGRPHGEERSRRKPARAKFQESFKSEGVEPRGRTVREVPAIEPNNLEELNLEIWLGGRDSNPDNVVQRAVSGLRSASVRSGFRDPLSGLLSSVLLRSRAMCLNLSHLSFAVTLTVRRKASAAPV
jgi:hypothetical protein